MGYNRRKGGLKVAQNDPCSQALLKRSPWLLRAVAVQAEVGAGEVLYVPTHWATVSESLDLSAQCKCARPCPGAALGRAAAMYTAVAARAHLLVSCLRDGLTPALVILAPLPCTGHTLSCNPCPHPLQWPHPPL